MKSTFKLSGQKLTKKMFSWEVKDKKLIMINAQARIFLLSLGISSTENLAKHVEQLYLQWGGNLIRSKVNVFNTNVYRWINSIKKKYWRQSGKCFEMIFCY